MQATKGLKANKYTKELQRIKIGFLRQETSITAFCERNGIDKRNAVKAIKGTWKGEKATELKKRLTDASKGKVTQ